MFCTKHEKHSFSLTWKICCLYTEAVFSQVHDLSLDMVLSWADMNRSCNTFFSIAPCSFVSDTLSLLRDYSRQKPHWLRFSNVPCVPVIELLLSGCILLNTCNWCTDMGGTEPDVKLLCWSSPELLSYKPQGPGKAVIVSHRTLGPMYIEHLSMGPIHTILWWFQIKEWKAFI